MSPQERQRLLLTDDVRAVLEQPERQQRQQPAGQSRVPGVGPAGGRGHSGGDECLQGEYRQPFQQIFLILIDIHKDDIYNSSLLIRLAI